MRTLRLTNTLFDNLFNSGLSHVYHELDDNVYGYEEDESGYQYELNLAGYKKENIKVSIDNNLLKVTARQGDRSYSKALSVPQKADSTSSLVRYEDGILRIKINKKESAKTIELDIG